MDSAGSFGRGSEDVNSNESNVNSLVKGVSHTRSQSLSAVSPAPPNMESPKHLQKTSTSDLNKSNLKYETTESGLKYENERLRLALAQRLVF